MSIDHIQRREQELDGLEQALREIEKTHGAGAAMFGDQQATEPVQVIPTGSVAIDRALGVGGIPRGRMVEIYGPESSGKTTFCYELIHPAQLAGEVCVFVDTVHAMDRAYAEAVGVDFARLIVSQPDSGEQALDIVERLVKSGGVGLVVIDSVAALVPKAELEGELTDQQPGMQARLMSRAMRRLAGVCSTAQTAVVFTNQQRERIGQAGYGSPLYTPGGRALRYFATIRMEIRRVGAVKDGEEMIGNQTIVNVKKNKVAVPFREARFTILYGHGYDREGELLDLGAQNDPGLVTRAGTHYRLRLEDGTEAQLGQGLKRARAWLMGRLNFCC
jgi:recombination protein RecA